MTKVLVTDPIAIFFIVLLIILSAPLLLNRLKIPHIIGLIVAGLAVGPYGFKILDNDVSFEIFGQVGLIYLMFLAGLEIDMYHLKKNLKKGLVFGVLTLILPLAIGVVTSLFFLRLDWLTSLLLGSMYAAHTLISYPVASRYGITRSPAVLISIVGTIVAIVGALLVLSGTISVRREGVFKISLLLKLVGSLFVYVVVILYAYPRLTRAFFKRVADRVTQFLFVLALVFFASLTAEMIGFQAVLGAFFAGLVLNRYIPANSSLMSNIEFVGNALFIPYFLISVGMMINLGVVLNADTLGISFLMFVVSIVSKWVPAYVAQKINGFSSPSRNVMFGLTAAHTAVALVVVKIGCDLDMFDERILNSTILVILMTCAVAPIFTAGAARKLKIELLEEEEGEYINRPLRHNNSLISIASRELAAPLVDLAVLMRNFRGTHNFYAMHVRNENSERAKYKSEAILKEARKAGAAADIQIQTIDRYGLNVVSDIINAMDDKHITEVVVGLHRRSNVIDSFLGTSVPQLLRDTKKMVMIARTYIPANTFTRIAIYVPPKAQYETGFGRWVRAIARLAHQVGCRAIFCCPSSIQPYISSIIYQENFGIRCEFRTVESWGDFIPMINRVLIDDLLVVIGARVNSVSYSDEMAEISRFIDKNLTNNNLLLIYPEQSGTGTPPSLSFADPMAADIESAPSPMMLKIRTYYNKAIKFKRSISHRNRKKR